MTTLNIPTPVWALPFLQPMRYKGLKGGRASAKSHFFAELAVETMIADPYVDMVCLRESLKSLKFSAKKLIEGKIHAFKATSQFRILDSEIRRIGTDGTSTGIIIFQGMQDHTADSIKSLEGFSRAWFEEASRMSERSLKLLLPTIREDDSEIWFSWNPDQETDPIEEFMVKNPRRRSICTHLTFKENPFCPKVIIEEAEEWLRINPDSYDHVWLGAFNTKSADQVLAGKWLVEEFEVDPKWAGPYYGADWGFSTDPNTVIQCFVDTVSNRIYVRRELWELHVEIDDTEKFFDGMPGCKNHVCRADNARPEMVSHMVRHNYPYMVSAEKWPGSIEDGISKLRGYTKIVIHPDCPKTAEECRLYKYKRDRLTDDILPDIVDKHNHCIDALRYAIEPLTKQAAVSFWD